MGTMDQGSFYKRAIDTFEIPADKAEKIAAQMVALGVSRDDEYMLLFLATGRIEHLVEALPASIKKEGMGIIKEMGITVSKALDEKLAAVPAQVRKDLSAVMERSLGDLVKNVNVAVSKEADQRFREADRNYDLKRTAIGVVGALALVVALSIGYVVGRDAVTADALKWQSVVNLEDGGKWLGLARLNDLDKVLAQSCGPNDGRVISGAKQCDLTMFVSQPVATSKGTDYVRLSFAEQANKLGWAGYVLALGVGVIVGKVRWRRRGY